MDPNDLCRDDQAPILLLEDETNQFYQTAGYWLMSSQPMNGMFPINPIGGFAFDPCEELVWCVSRTGQLTGFYGSTLEPYVTTPVTAITSDSSNTGAKVCELRQILPSTSFNEHVVFVLGSDALYVYSKFGRPLGYATDPQMAALECITPYVGFPNSGNDGPANFDRFFCGGLQNSLLELDGRDNWGQVVRTIDVGDAGCVMLESFGLGLCAANTIGKVKIVDPRSALGVVRQLDAHTGEISDMAVLSNSYTLVTCGWSRLANASLRMDKLINVYDLRFGRLQSPVSSLVDPGLVSFCMARSEELLVASQTGSFQVLKWGERLQSPLSVGNLLLGYDRLNNICQSSNGQCILFGTETGNLHLYCAELQSCRFNTASISTEFASPLAEGLHPTDADDVDEGAIETSLPPTTTVALAREAGRRLARMARSAAASVDLQVFGASLFQPSVTPSINNGGLMVGGDHHRQQHLLRLAEHRRMLAVPRVLAAICQPVSDFDGNATSSEFYFSAVPFATDPPVCAPADLAEWVCIDTGSRREGITSDWPPDLCGDRSRPMLSPDVELLAQINQKGIVGKPESMGPVWFPYAPLVYSSDLSDLGVTGLSLPRKEHVESHVERVVKAITAEKTIREVESIAS